MLSACDFPSVVFSSVTVSDVSSAVALSVPSCAFVVVVFEELACTLETGFLASVASTASSLRCSESFSMFSAFAASVGSPLVSTAAGVASTLSANVTFGVMNIM